MRIALAVTGGVDRSGRRNVVPALLWLIERLARRHTVAVYVLRYHDRPCSYPLLGATVHDLGTPRGALAQHRALHGALRRDGPFDVVHAYWALPAGLAAGTAARRLRTPFVLTLDSGELVWIPEIAYGLQGRRRHRLAVRAASTLAGRVTVSTRYMQQLAYSTGITADLIPLGVDTRLFTPAPRPDGPPWRLLHVASLNPVKNQATLLDAFRRVLDAVPDCRLDIAGEDTLGGALQQRAHALAIDRHVAFHGAVASADLVPLYQGAHLFVLSSLHEAANVAVLEAAACGVPAVGTRVGYLSDWTHAPSVAPRDADGLARAIVHMLADRPAAQAIADTSRAWALTHDADWTAARFERVYEEVAAAATTPRFRRPPAR